MAKKDSTKKDMEKLRKKLIYSPGLIWDAIGSAEKKKVFSFGEEYKKFLDRAKTEREAVVSIRRMARDNWFSENVKPGSCMPMIRVFHEKAIALVKPGTGPLEDGIHLIVSHIDSPRLDLKQNPRQRPFSPRQASLNPGFAN